MMNVYDTAFFAGAEIATTRFRPLPESRRSMDWMRDFLKDTGCCAVGNVDLASGDQLHPISFMGDTKVDATALKAAPITPEDESYIARSLIVMGEHLGWID